MKVLKGCVQTHGKLVQCNERLTTLYTILLEFWTDLLRVTLLPLVHQGPHDGLAEGARLYEGGLKMAPDPPGTSTSGLLVTLLGLVLGGSWTSPYASPRNSHWLPLQIDTGSHPDAPHKNRMQRFLR